jgi:hypothetical protein
MPSTSAKQHRFMEAIAHNSAFAKKAGVPQSVGKDFSAADKGKKFAGGGATKQKINLQDTRHGAMDMPFKSLRKFAGMKAGGDVPTGYKKGDEMNPKMIKGSNMPKMEPRMAAMRRPMQAPVAMPGAEGGMKFAKGGMAHGGMAMKKGGMPMKDGKPAFMQKMNMGGMAKYAKGGGIESKGKTVGSVIKMASGGSVSSRADGIASRGKTNCKIC